MSDTEQSLFTLLEIVEQQQKNITAAVTTLGATREQLQRLMGEIQTAATQSAGAAAQKAVQELIVEAAGPVLKRLNQVAANAAGVEAQFRRASAWVTWQHLSMVGAGCAALVLAVWVAVAWQRQELTQIRDQKTALEMQVATMQKTAEELATKGGKIKSTVCGDQKRRCVKVNRAAGIFGDTSDYMILDGY